MQTPQLNAARRQPTERARSTHATVRNACLSVAAFIAFATLAPSAFATQPYVLQWDAPGDCPSVAELRERLDELALRDARNSPLRIVANIRATPSESQRPRQLKLQLRLDDEATRTFEADNCSVLAETLVVLSALALGVNPPRPSISASTPATSASTPATSTSTPAGTSASTPATSASTPATSAPDPKPPAQLSSAPPTKSNVTRTQRRPNPLPRCPFTSKHSQARPPAWQPISSPHRHSVSPSTTVEHFFASAFASPSRPARSMQRHQPRAYPWRPQPLCTSVAGS